MHAACLSISLLSIELTFDLGGLHASIHPPAMLVHQWLSHDFCWLSGLVPCLLRGSRTEPVCSVAPCPSTGSAYVVSHLINC